MEDFMQELLSQLPGTGTDSNFRLQKTMKSRLFYHSADKGYMKHRDKKVSHWPSNLEP